MIKIESNYLFKYLIRNYAKDYRGFFTRIISKVSDFTVSQYINKINDNPIGRIKYALA